jgi:[ribosomal protein S5]-alanine N-acetyltransferase
MIAGRLQTARLTLVPASASHVLAELDGAEQLGALLGASVPPSWPPGEYDDAARRYFLARLSEAGDEAVGWYGWYAIRTETPAVLIACGGYFGPPDDSGTVEIGYSVCPEWTGLGFATEIAGTLAAHAIRQPGVRRVLATTTLANPASIRVLERSGFTASASGPEPDSVRFEYAASSVHSTRSLQGDDSA